MMPANNLVIRGKKVVLPESIAPASLHISNGVITAIESYENLPTGYDLIESGEESLVMPGLVDTHVHINEPGRAEWEGFATATKAAAAGGVTTLIDMPVNSIPPTTTHEAFHSKVQAAAGRILVDVGFWGGLVPGNAAELDPLRAAGIFGFKGFLSPSGVPEFREVAEEDLRAAMPRLAGGPLLVHAEWPALLAPMEGSSRAYASYLGSRPRAAENEAVDRIVHL